MSLSEVTVVGLYNYDNSLFDGLTLPDGVDKETAVFTILEKNGDFGVIYPDFEFMKECITRWSITNQSVFTKMWATVTAEYNILENYDRISDITRINDGIDTATSIDAQTSFNSLDFRETAKNTGNSTSHNNETVTDRTHGNIGVTSSQQMIMQERTVALFNFYDFVADLFAIKFCIKIY